jgi:hypothetical protein
VFEVVEVGDNSFCFRGSTDGGGKGRIGGHGGG